MYETLVIKWRAFVIWLQLKWCISLNWFGNRMRDIFGVGLRLQMNPLLANELVTLGSCFSIRVHGGEQTPILDAIAHLVATKDEMAIASLRTLFDRHAKDILDTPLASKFVIAQLQDVVAEALLALYTKSDAKKFVEAMLTTEEIFGLGYPVASRFIEYAVSEQMSQLDIALFSVGEQLLGMFDAEWAKRKRNVSYLVSYEYLYVSLKLIFGAYCITDDTCLRDAALTRLIVEYNHPDAQEGEWPHRPHDEVAKIIAYIIQGGVDYPEKMSMRLLLNPEQFAIDAKRYNIPLDTLP